MTAVVRGGRIRGRRTRRGLSRSRRSAAGSARRRSPLFLVTHHSSGCSFSAVSTPILATKYAFFSVFRDLQNDLADFCKICKIKKNWQNSAKFCKNPEISRKFCKICLKYAKNCKILHMFCKKLQDFGKFS